MGSPAQDRRHQDILDNAKQRVFETKSKITQKKTRAKGARKTVTRS